MKASKLKKVFESWHFESRTGDSIRKDMKPLNLLRGAVTKRRVFFSKLFLGAIVPFFAPNLVKSSETPNKTNKGKIYFDAREKGSPKDSEPIATASMYGKYIDKPRFIAISLIYSYLYTECYLKGYNPSEIRIDVERYVL